MMKLISVSFNYNKIKYSNKELVTVIIVIYFNQFKIDASHGTFTHFYVVIEKGKHLTVSTIGC